MEKSTLKTYGNILLYHILKFKLYHEFAKEDYFCIGHPVFVLYVKFNEEVHM